MSVHLVGGGTDSAAAPEIYGPFLAEAAARASSRAAEKPLIALVSVGHSDRAGAYREWLSSAGECELREIALEPGDEATIASLQDVDGIFVAGGETPAYLRAVEPVFGEIRRQVASGVPYLGYSAGAMIAAQVAIIGGWRIGGIPVCPEEWSENLDDVTVDAGMGLVDITVDVHAAQAGTLTRLVAATEAGLVTDGGVAIDENTVLIAAEGALRVAGRGTVWLVTPDTEGAVRVSSFGHEIS